MRLKLILFTLCNVAAMSVQAGQAPGYHLISRIQIGGQGGWDYLTFDPNSRRLFVSHGDQVNVIDTQTRKVIGAIPGTPGAHGIALIPEAGRGYISAGNADRVVVIDLKKLIVVGEISTGKKPDAIVYDVGSGRLLVANGESNDISVIDPRTSRTITTIPLGGAPEFVVADGNGHAWVNLMDRNETAMLDLNANVVQKRFALSGCDKPSSLAMDSQARRLFAGCRNKVLTVLDADTGKIVAHVPIGDHVDASVFDADRKLIFNSNGDGTMTVIHEETPDRFIVVETVTTQRGAKTMALDPRSKEIYLSTADGLPPNATGGPSSKGPPTKTGPFTVLVLGL